MFGDIVPEGGDAMNFVRETDRCTLTLDARLPRLFFRQRWQYMWIAAPGQAVWTYREKRGSIPLRTG